MKIYEDSFSHTEGPMMSLAVIVSAAGGLGGSHLRHCLPLTVSIILLNNASGATDIGPL